VIRINQDSSQNIYVTLTENKVGTSDYYLMECTNQVTNDISYCILFGDSSNFKERYNEFDIFLDTNNEYKGLSKSLYLPYSGFYTYVIYETTLTAGQYNNLTDAEEATTSILGQLETGLLWYIPTAQNNTEYNPADSTTFVYTPQ
jgi:hypothetical protein